MADLLIVLATTFVAGLLARVIHLPPLVGFLAAGFGLHAIGFQEPTGLETLADLGVTLLLFGIGLRLDVRFLLRREVWLTAGVHMLFSVALGIGFLALLGAVGLRLLAGESFGTLALVAFALSFSSTVLAIKVLEERSDSLALYGRIAVGILVVQDLAAVIFLAVAEGDPPSAWAFSIVLLVPAAWVFRRVWNFVGHGELQALFGLAMALLPGYALFEAVGLKGDLGALVVGMLLASHPAAGEVAKSLLSLKDLLLVAFFVSIGMAAALTPDAAVLALLLVVLLPLEALAFTALLRMMGLRYRTSLLAGLALGNYSEFGLIVGAVGTSVGLLDERWLAAIAMAVALGLVVSAIANRFGYEPLDELAARLPERAPERLHPDDRPIDVGRAEAVVLGMGRVGRATYEQLTDAYGLTVVGVEHDSSRATKLRAAGYDVEVADATDVDFWKRVNRAREVSIAVLAMPFHGSNLAALQELRQSGFRGHVAAIARYDDDVDELRERGAHVVFHLYGSAGIALADGAAEAAASGPTTEE
ncbi:cation:proton antiporter [Georgenia halophila]|uniref:Cation:proton antiporter n=1 Tax=Georgenia halophila TaxID=620889 RepID=A0ABP8L4B5_9MICO